ncbi:methylmalonyl-CoA mutase family protein [Methylocella sp.]|uniref:methylmalonyl-CoA mutase family protein n=1 Tax=Methylocella sp. TaxID=1978226 RepID=UPI00378523CF
MSAAGSAAVPGNEAVWRSAVARIMAKDPAGRLPEFSTSDGIPLAPLYARGGDALGQPLRASAACRIVQRMDHPDPFEAKSFAHADLEGGADGLSIAFAGAPAARGFGLRAQNVEDLNQALGGVHLDMIAVRLEPAPGGVAAALQFSALVEGRGFDASLIDVDFGFDPIGALALRGGPPTNWKDDEGAVMRACAALRERGFRTPLMRADGRPYSEAGATEAEELASVLASGLAYMRALESAGRPHDGAAPAVSFTLVAGVEILPTIAKLRALRRLWALVEDCCGVEPAPLALHAETSWRMMTRRDVYANVLRGTLGCAAAMIGGADSVTVLPLTGALGLPDDFARRIARNTGTVLAQESFLDRVLDPAGGSGAIEALTDGLCEKAWELFQKIETAGGFPKAMASGFWQDTLAASRARRRHEVVSRARPITGVSIFPNLGETTPATLPLRREPATLQRAHGALVCERDSEPFELLRDRSDAWLAAHGARPGVLIALLAVAGGRPDAAQRRAADFARGVFEAGGFAAPGAESFSDPEQIAAAGVDRGALAVCLCLGDAAGLAPELEELAEAAARRLSVAGVRVVISGWPGAAEGGLRRAGVEDFIFKGSDSVSFLQRVWDRKPRP